MSACRHMLWYQAILPDTEVKLYSISCTLQDPTISQRQAALFNSTAVHASFGDIELAQITLRGVPLTSLLVYISWE